MLAVVGGQAAVAGLLLVYQGYLLAVLSALPVDTSARVRAPYRKAILAALGAFVVADLSSIGALAWLLGVDLFWVVVGAAVMSLASLLAVAVYTTTLLLRAKG